MENRVKIYLILPTNERGPAAKGLVTDAYLRYKVGRDFRLYKAAEEETRSGGLMMINVPSAVSAASVLALAGDIVRECVLKNYEGVMIDASANSRPIVSLVSALSPHLRRKGIKLYLPRDIATETGARRIITAAPDEGNIRALLDTIKTKYQRGAFAIDTAVRRKDILLSKGGQARDHTYEEMESLIRSQSPTFFYSEELMAQYATFSDQNGEHMLLCDNADSIAERITAAGQFGAEAVFLVWKEIRPFWPRLEELLRERIKPRPF